MAYVTLLVLVIGAMALVVVRTRSANEADTRAVSRLWIASQGLKGSLVDQETAVRGFALTGDERYLEPYRAGRARVDLLLSRLEDAFAGQPRRRSAVLTVHERLERWRAAVASRQIAAMRAGERDEAIEIETSGVARERFDQVRDAFDDLTVQIDDDRRDRLDASTDRPPCR